MVFTVVQRGVLISVPSLDQESAQIAGFRNFFPFTYLTSGRMLLDLLAQEHRSNWNGLNDLKETSRETIEIERRDWESSTLRLHFATVK